MTKRKPFYILALDGGGTRGIYSAKILECLEKSLNVPIRCCFDLIAGTSTGSIIAGAAAIGTPMEKVVELFECEGPEIFRRKFPRFSLISSKYPKGPLKRAIGKHLSSTVKLGEILTPLMIMSSDITTGGIWVFKSKYMKERGYDYDRDSELLLRDAIVSSCAAPTFFAPHKVRDSVSKRESCSLLADGGLWANNPSIFAYTEALSKFGKKIKQIRILSIGTGPETSNTYNSACCWGFLTGWGHQKFIHYILDLQSQASTNMADLLLNRYRDKSRDQYLRIQPNEAKGDLDTIGTNYFNALKRDADADYEENESKIKRRFIKSFQCKWA